MKGELGLRERKKLEARAAMSRAARELMVERGIEAVTAEAVAEAVGVSARTFRNYFSSGEEAIVDGIVQHAGTIVEALQARPADEPVWESLEIVLPVQIASLVGLGDDLAILMRASRERLALLGQHLAAFERLQQSLVDTIAERTGTDPATDLAPRLLAEAAAMAMRTSVTLWAEGGGHESLPDLVRESVAQLRAGLPTGAVAPTA